MASLRTPQLLHYTWGFQLWFLFFGNLILVCENHKPENSVLAGLVLEFLFSVRHRIQVLEAAAAAQKKNSSDSAFMVFICCCALLCGRFVLLACDMEPGLIGHCWLTTIYWSFFYSFNRSGFEIKIGLSIWYGLTKIAVTSCILC